MVRSLLAKGRTKKSFCPEAITWSIHVLNRSPTFSFKNMNPEQAWSGRSPAIDHFRIFGCIAYAHVPDEKRKKLDDKSEKCVFLDFSETSKAYKLFNPQIENIVINRDVFDEGTIWYWNMQQPTPVLFENELKTDLNTQNS